METGQTVVVIGAVRLCLRDFLGRSQSLTPHATGIVQGCCCSGHYVSSSVMQWTIRSSGGGAQLSNSPHSVSYTHLTLPTNREV